MVTLHKKVPRLSQASLESFVLRARRAAGLRGLADVMVTSSTVLRSLNRQFRGKDRATDVLSFPSQAPAAGAGKSALAGEIAISADIAAQNAARFGHSPADEVKILALHGILHLAGFDHERDNGAMARKEMKLRRQLRLPVALIERTRSLERESSKPKAGNTRRAAARRAP